MQQAKTKSVVHFSYPINNNDSHLGLCPAACISKVNCTVIYLSLAALLALQNNQISLLVYTMWMQKYNNNLTKDILALVPVTINI